VRFYIVSRHAWSTKVHMRNVFRFWTHRSAAIYIHLIVALTNVYFLNEESTTPTVCVESEPSRSSKAHKKHRSLFYTPIFSAESGFLFMRRA
jgi:heme A synthase